MTKPVCIVCTLYESGALNPDNSCKQCKKRKKGREDARKYREKNLERLPDINLNNYGLSRQDYQNMLEAQQHRCAICRGKDDDIKLSVDHDHLTGRIRGLLCRKCNSGIGMLQDSRLLLQRAIEYLGE